VYTFKICSTFSSPSLEELSDPLIGSTSHQQKVLIHWLVDSLYCGCRQRMYFHFMQLLGIAISDCQCFFIFEKRVQFLEFSLNPIVFVFFFFPLESAAMLCFSSYVLISGGNPPPKKLKSSPSVAS
jgi:hypothetical protein